MNKLNIAIITLALLLTGCEKNNNNDIKKLESLGYTNPKITSNGSMNISCGMPTSPTGVFHREFEAEKDSKKVQGVICAGIFGDFIHIKNN